MLCAGFLCCSEQGSSVVAVSGLPITAASLAAERRLSAFRSFGSQALLCKKKFDSNSKPVMIMDGIQMIIKVKIIVRHISICDGEAAYYNSREELQMFRIIFDGPLEHFYG
ncbi:hypothetical protein JEQ12_018328 [Ovis aries]|uniref:Uncharacterized protein n=1 Tax=Ovis aries TaxID=9940 RepID=A0A836D437_SHEEP|nr:hypothetical protein JEQ12_018328 [Ovis aries]